MNDKKLWTNFNNNSTGYNVFPDENVEFIYSSAQSILEQFKNNKNCHLICFHIVKELTDDYLNKINKNLICNKNNIKKLKGHGIISENNEYFIVDKTTGISDRNLEIGDIISIWKIPSNTWKDTNDDILLILSQEEFYRFMVETIIENNCKFNDISHEINLLKNTEKHNDPFINNIKKHFDKFDNKQNKRIPNVIRKINRRIRRSNLNDPKEQCNCTDNRKVVEDRLKKYETEGLNETSLSVLLATACPHWQFENTHFAAKMILETYKVVPR